MRYRPRRTDTTQSEVITTLKECGCRCWVIAEPCDLLVWYPRRRLLFLLECKGVDKRERGPNQLLLKQLAAAEGLPYRVIRQGESVTALLDELLASLPRKIPSLDAGQSGKTPGRR